MKSMKKILSAILTVAILAALITVPVSAATSSDAQVCETINVLRGDGSGVTEVYLAKNTNRSQGAKILLRLMGLEVEADAYAGTATFTDADTATPYWQPMLAYLKANPGVGFQGYPDGTFAPNKIMTAQEIYKVLLVSLGYVENVDFTWSEVFSFAAGKGMTALAGAEEITNDDLATALVEALEATKKDGEDLIQFLIDEGVVSLIDAQNAGLVATTLTLTDAFASGSKEITATLNMAAPTGTTAILKRGTVNWPVDVNWDTNRKVVKFSRAYNLTPGEYTVVVGESSKTITILAETLTGISIGADYIFPLANQDLQISLYNQYGEPMTITSTTVLVYNLNKGTALVAQNMGTTIKVDASNDALVEGGDSLSVSVIKGGLSQVKTITVSEQPKIKSLYIGGLEIADAAATIGENTNGHKLLISASDQYGNPYILSPADIMTGGLVMLTGDNDAVVPSSSFIIDGDGKLVFNALTAGTAIITFIVPTEAIIRTYTVTVNQPASIETLIITPGSGMITSGTRFDLIAYATSQLGVSIPLKGNFDFNNFTMFSTNTMVVPLGGIQYDSGAGVLYLLPAGTGSTTISYYYNGIYQGAMPVTVYNAAEAQYIESISFPTLFEVGASKSITMDDIVVKDQYGNVFDMDNPAYSVGIAVSSGTTVTLGGSTITSSVSSSLTATSTEGTTSFTLRILKNGVPVARSETGLSVEVVGTEDITSFVFDNVSTMYAGGSGMTQYHKTLKINGKIGSSTVVLAGGAVPSAIWLVSSDNSDFVINGTTLELYANDAGSSTIRAFITGVVTPITLTVQASDVAPKVNTMVFDDNSLEMGYGETFDIKSILTIKDQYGVDITTSASVAYNSSKTSIAVINSVGVITSGSTDGTTSISVVETSGAGSAILTLTVAD